MMTRTWQSHTSRPVHRCYDCVFYVLCFIVAMLVLAGCAQTRREGGLPVSVVSTTPSAAVVRGNVPAAAAAPKTAIGSALSQNAAAVRSNVPAAPVGINATVAPSDVPHRMRGLYAFTGNSGSFMDCTSGQRLPVSPEADSMTLERAYGISRSFGESLLTSVEASLAIRPAVASPTPDSPAPKPMLVVQRFISLSSDTACPPQPATVALQGTYWKLEKLRGNAIELPGVQTEPHLVMQIAKSRGSGSSGCNRLTGTYLLKGNRLNLTRIAVIGKPCREGGKQAQAFTTALRQVVSWRVADGQLLLADTQGSPIIQFSAQPKR